MLIPFKDFGGEGEIIHFAHANGFPPGGYKRFLENLTKDYKVLAMHQRPMWNPVPNASTNWLTLANDLITFLDRRGMRDIIGMGHSMGGVATTLAAAKRPDLFKKIVLIEPVFFASYGFFLFGKMPHFLRKKFHPMMQAALRRRDVWESHEAIFTAYRKKRVFSGLPDDVLQDYVDSLLVEREDGKFTFTYSKEWEAHIYGSVPWVWPRIKKISCPVLGIRGKSTDTLRPDAVEKWKKLSPSTKILEMEGGHLVPMEKPEEVAEEILNFLKGD